MRLALDWNRPDIDWRGRGGDRGLRGIAFDGDRVFIAASDELFAYTPDFRLIDSWRNPYLKRCHELAVWERTLYLTSTAFDAVLGFDLDTHQFHWAIHVETANFRFKPSRFDPRGDDGPLMLNKLHLNSIFCSQNGMYVTGLRSGGMLHFNGRAIRMAVELPAGTHNAQPFRDGVLFNDTEADVLRYSGRGEGLEDRALTVPQLDPDRIEHQEAISEGLVRPGFARGLAVLSDRAVAAGSSPATVALYDLPANELAGAVSLSRDVRTSIHALARWPFE